MAETKPFYQPQLGHAGLRSKECLAGSMLDPANCSKRDVCPASELNYQVRHLDVEQFAKAELEQIGFTVVQKEKVVPLALCNKCGNEIRLREIIVL